MKDKNYKTGICIHKLTWQVGWKIIISQFLDHIKTSDLHQTLISLSLRKNTVNLLSELVISEEFRNAFVDYLETRCEHKTFAFFVTYLKMVQILFTFNNAQRDGNWDL